MTTTAIVANLERLHPQEFVQFAELRHTKDRWAGQAFKLYPFQREILDELFQEKNGNRVYNQGLIGMARKNGKSELGAAIGLTLAFADGVFGAEAYAVAGDRDQARRVHEVSKRMVSFSPVLSKHLRLFRDSIYDPRTDSVYRVVSSDAPLKHGLNPSGVVFDEVWNQPNRELWEAMTTGSGTREEPLIVGLTTAGYDRESLAWELYERGRKGEDPKFYFWWAGLPADSDLDFRDPEAWKLANPALGKFLRLDFLKDEVRRLPEASFRRWHLNQWTSSVSRWIPMSDWDACSRDVSIEPGDEVWVGVDGAAKRDTTAVVVVTVKGEELHAKATVFEPPGAGEIIDPNLVEGFLRQLARDYDVREIAYDPHLFFRSAVLLQEEGLPMLEFPQSHARMVPASQALFDAVMEGRLRHGGDPVLRAHADGAVARETDRGWRLDKDKATAHIDAVVALAMAVQRAVENSGEYPAGMTVIEY